jgi:hypothetical protein
MRSLLQLSLEALAANIKRLRSLQGIPEELAIELFDLVLRQGTLTPEVRHAVQWMYISCHNSAR